MFEFTSKLNSDDYIKYHLYNINNSKRQKVEDIKTSLLLPCLYIAGILIYSVSVDMTFWITLVFASIVGLAMPRLQRLMHVRYFKAKYKEDISRNHFMEKKYLFDKSGMKMESTGLVISSQWNNVVKVCEDDNAFYFYSGPFSAVVLVKRSIGDEKKIDEFREFIDSVTKHENKEGNF